MPMSGPALGSTIKSAIIEVYGPPGDDAKLAAFCNALGKAIVDYLKANAKVQGTVTSGAGAGGSVEGTVL